MCSIMCKKYLKYAGIALVVFLLIVAMQPSEYKVERSLTINATTRVLFTQANNFRRWQMWSPWAKIDPKAKMTFEGAPWGEGAIMRWDGNREVGKGSMEITKSSPNRAIQYKLVFLSPMKGEATSEFTFTPVPKGGTKVTWSMSGKNGFFGKLMGLALNCEKMIGDKYEEGLANLKKVVEAAPTAQEPAAEEHFQGVSKR